MPAMLGDKTFKIQGTFKSVINFPLKILTEVILSTVWQKLIKSILLWKNQNSNAFDGTQND